MSARGGRPVRCQACRRWHPSVVYRPDGTQRCDACDRVERVAASPPAEPVLLADRLAELRDRFEQRRSR
jgi:hypothetical protein